MKISELMSNINDAVRAIDDDTPTEGSDEWNYWLRVINRKKSELYQDVTKQWVSTYAVAELGTVTATAQPSFDLDDEFLALSDSCYVITTEGTRIDYEIIKPQEKDPYKQQVFIAGIDPQTLYFSKPIESTSNVVAGTLYLPGYFMPPDFTKANEIVNVDDPYWLIMASAAEIAGNDLSYEDKEPNLTSKANNLYRLMVRKAQRGTFGNPRKSRTNVVKIGQRHSRR